MQRESRHLHVHRVHLAPELQTTLNGMPVTSLAQTLSDLASIWSYDWLEPAFEAATRRAEFESAALIRLLESSNRKGSGGLRSLARELQGSAPLLRSGLERRFRRYVSLRRLGNPTYNALVAGLECDVVWFAERLVVEIDTRTHHERKLAFERDRRRDIKLQRAGFRVIRVTGKRLDEEPDQVMEEIQALLAMAAAS